MKKGRTERRMKVGFVDASAGLVASCREGGRTVPSISNNSQGKDAINTKTIMRRSQRRSDGLRYSRHG